MSYIPAHGSETMIQAMIDYCRLRRTSEKSDNFAEWLAGALVNPLNRDDAYLVLLGPKEVAPYSEHEGEKYMNAAHLEHFRTILLSWKRQLRDMVSRSELKSHLYRQLGSARLRDRIDSRASDFEPALSQRAETMIAKIDGELRRIENGTYGYCEETGQPIGISRLEDQPVATHSVEAQDRRYALERKTLDRQRDDALSTQGNSMSEGKPRQQQDMSAEDSQPPQYIGRSVIALLLSLAIFIVSCVLGTLIAAKIGREGLFVHVIVPGVSAFFAPVLASQIVRDRYNPKILGWGFFAVAIALVLAHIVLVLPASIEAGISVSDKFLGALQTVAIAGGSWLAYRELTH